MYTYTYSYIYIYIKISISHIQYGNIPIRDPLPPHPTPFPPSGPPAGGPGMRWVGWGGIPHEYISMLDTGYWMHTYMYRYIYIYTYIYIYVYFSGDR